MEYGSRSESSGLTRRGMMRNVAAALSEDEIDAVASYVQGLR